MYRYVVERRFKQADGNISKVTDFCYTRGIKDARALCGGKLSLSREDADREGLYSKRVVYSGINGNILYRVTRLGRYI